MKKFILIFLIPVFFESFLNYFNQTGVSPGCAPRNEREWRELLGMQPPERDKTKPTDDKDENENQGQRKHPSSGCASCSGRTKN